MELVVRTPYGDADVDLVAHEDTARLLDLVQEVTGQAAPRVIRVDGRTLPAEVAVTDANLVVGSVVDTTAGADSPPTGSRRRLVQLTDHGTGVERELVDGRYRVGPGRRLHAGELERAPVEHTAFELEVMGDDVRVSTGETDRPVRLAGAAVRIPRPWRDELLDTGRRVFALRAADETVDVPAEAAPDGTIPFHRSPLAAASSEEPASDRPLLTVAAADAARARSPLVWSRRARDPDAFTISIGLDERLRPVGLDLGADGSAAVVGSERFRTALARALLVEAATVLGPAHLRVLVATTTDRAVDWEWSKWLPHLRTEGDVAVATTVEEVHAWADHVATDRGAPDRRSLVVTDEIHWWRGRDAPLRRLWTSGAGRACVLVLSDDATAVPGTSSTIVVLQPTGEVRLHRVEGPGRPPGGLAGGTPRDGTVIRPPLVSVALAEDVARRLAPLDDVELVRPVGPVAPYRPRLSDVLGDPGSAEWRAERAQRWSAHRRSGGDAGPGRVALGRPVGPPAADHSGDGDDAIVQIDLRAPGHLLVTADGTLDAVDAVTTLVVGAAVDVPPDRWSFVRVGHGSLSGLDHLDQLPHAAGRWADASPLGVDRMVRRITHAARDATVGQFLVIVEDVMAVAAEMEPLLEALVELATSGDRLRLLVVALGPPEHLPDEAQRVCRTHIHVGSVGALAHGRLTRDGQPPVGYVPLAPLARSDTGGGLVVGAAVRARPPSSLERRLLRRRRDASGDDPAAPFAATAAALRAVSGTTETAETVGVGIAPPPVRRLVPPPLPEEEDVEALLARWPGDAVPLGCVDRPESDEPAPYWWLPQESGSLLTIGSRRSAHDHLLSTVVVGVAARFSADDLHLYEIGATGPRPRAAARLPHCGGIVDPHDTAAVDALVELLEDEAAQRRGQGRRDRLPDIVLLVDDVGELRRPLGQTPIVDRLARLAADSARSGIHVIAAAVRAQDCRPLVHACDELLVGALTDTEDAARLALPDAAVVEERGQCWSRRTDRIVQLARPPADLESAVVARAPEPATSRPPRRPAR